MEVQRLTDQDAVVTVHSMDVGHLDRGGGVTAAESLRKFRIRFESRTNKIS